MDESLLTRDGLSYEQYATTPKPEDITPNSVARKQKSSETKTALRRGADEVIITHCDADGYTSGALLVEQSEGNPITIPVEYQGGYRLGDALADLIQTPYTDIDRLYIADLNPEGSEYIGQLSQIANAGTEIEWYDHHQWDDGLPAIYDEEAGVKLYIDTDECASSVIEREIDCDWDSKIQELVTVTKDRDLWINDDPRSHRLSVLSRILSVDEYISTVLINGVDFPAATEEAIDDKLAHDEKLEAKAVDRAKEHMVTNDFTVAKTYTRGGNTSNIGNKLVEHQTPRPDLAVVCTPSSVSYYSHSENGNFDHCHEVAAEFGGGGHPTAAGSGIPAETFHELAGFWASSGRSSVIENRIYDAIYDVVTDVEDGGAEKGVE